MSHCRRLAATLATAAALLAPAVAPAGPLVASAPDCSAASASQVFAPWLDPARYVLAPGGAAESGEGWTLTGGAAVTSGNEPYRIHGAGDAGSLSLPPGATATTATMCVGIERPDLRFFVSGGSLGGSVNVEALVETAAGDVVSLPVGVAGPGGWRPTPVMPIAASLLPLLPGDQTPVQFRFTARGGTFAIDDVYVDPWGRN